MRRRLASPAAERSSYCPPPPPPPPWMTLNISFEEPASFRLILQPVSFSNFFAKLGSVYAPHSTTFNAPSPGPIFVGSAYPPPLCDTPAAGTASATTSAPTTRCHLRIPFLTLPP